MNEFNLDSLNVEQKDAVINTEGTMLIVAGAGTGKTKVITSKILHLMKNCNVKPTSILALTFTEKATEEMVTRVDEHMPYLYDQICIKTFHGFCDMILKDKGIEIGIDPSFHLLDQTESWIFLKNNLFNLDLNYYRPLGNPTKFIGILINYFSRLKDEDITPDEYLEFANKLEEKAIDDSTKEEWKKHLELATVYKQFEVLKQKNSYLDFGDLQYYALQLLKNRPSVLNYYQEKFKYILVDEFQDTNYAQNKMVNLLAEKYKNLTVVGDDDQAIYKWRGASLSNILKFEETYPEAKKVVLVKNYRSAQNILDFSHESITNNNPLRLEAKQGIDKKLISNKEFNDKIEIHHFGSYLNENDFIADRISELVNNGAAFTDIAVLVRANSHAQSIAEVFKQKGIPFVVKDTVGLLQYEEIKDLIALLRFIVRPQDSIAFVRLLSLPIFKLPMINILELMGEAKDDGANPVFYFLRDKLAENEQNLIQVETKYDVFKNTYELFEKIIEHSKNNRSVTSILGEFLEQSGYYKSLTAVQNQDNDDKIIRIGQFYKLATDFSENDTFTPLVDFLDYLDNLEQANGLKMDKISSESDAVSILTVHSSKGLEFDFVFLPSLVAQRFPSSGKKDPIEIPNELIKEELPTEELTAHEERRLFYVACTRARKRLMISYSDAYEGAKKWKISPFLNEIYNNSLFDIYDHTNQMTSIDIVKPTTKQIESEHDQKIKYLPKFKVPTLSYSQIDTFKNCPLKYKFRYIFNLPSPSGQAASFGSSMHNTIKEFYDVLKNGGEPSEELIVELFNKNWIKKGYDTQALEKARKSEGLKMIKQFYEHEKIENFRQPDSMERPFRLRINNYLFVGRIDRINKLDDGTYEVVDYKTGKSKRENNDVNKDLQLSLYAAACRDEFKIKVSKLKLFFLEDCVELTTSRTDSDIEKVKTDVSTLADELVKSGFEPTPNFMCNYCEYSILCNAAK